MARFYSVLSFLYTNAVDNSEAEYFDLLSSLPIEVALMIFRLLPAKELLNAASVSKQWLEICKSDIILRKRLRVYLRRERKARLAAIIHDTNTRRIQTQRLGHRAAMTCIGNLPLNITASVGTKLSEKSRDRFTPYFRGPSEKMHRAVLENRRIGRLRM